MTTPSAAHAAPSLEQLLGDVNELPVLPEVAVRIFDEMRSPRVTAARMAEFIKKDPVLASSVLRIANSALYGGRTRISDLAFAIARVGLNQIRNLLLAMVLRSKMADPKVYGETGVALMDHGLAVAFGAGVVADTTGIAGSEAFMCGLLHDFGKLALIKSLRESNAGNALDEAQNAFITEKHGAAGAMLARAWELPDIVSIVAEHHHEVEDAPDGAGPMVAAVAFANVLAHRLGLGEPARTEIDLHTHPAKRILDMDETQIEEVHDYLPGLFRTARSALFG